MRRLLQAMEKKEFDLIIIGAGATGAGTARDCALRGLRVLLVERGDIAAGATGRNHGLLHSGARYAVTDNPSAKECIKENKILRDIASDCIEQNGGLFISLPQDSLSYQSMFVESCHQAGIDAEVIDPALARKLEPSVNPSIIGAVKVPDGSIDPFRLTLANLIDAKAHGATVAIYHEVTGFVQEQGRITGIETFDRKRKIARKFYAPLTIIAAGIWSHMVALKAGIKVEMFPDKGSLIIFGHRINNMVLNRCRKPSNADILVPGETISLIGTTSEHIGFDQVDNPTISADEVDLLLSEGKKLAPVLAKTRILRAYSGVRPLAVADHGSVGRGISRGITLLDHESRDGISGLVTITGGKLMTYRLMAEQATDLACEKLGVKEKCTTHLKALPRLTKGEKERESGKGKSHAFFKSRGARAEKNGSDSLYPGRMVCECENVNVGQIEYAIKELSARNLTDLRRRTRFGMGTCQGAGCAFRGASILGQTLNCPEKAENDLADFLDERWKGIYPVAWGETMRESEYFQWIYAGICGMEARDEN